MKQRRYSNIWDVIEDTPQEAASMRTGSDLMIQLTELIRKRGLSQAEAATLFGVTLSLAFPISCAARLISFQSIH